MTANVLDHESEARRIIAAHDEHVTLAPISDRIPLTMDDAYAIQAFVTKERLRRGESIVGWKLGYTSVAMRRQMGVTEPNFGPLTDAMVFGVDTDVGGRFTQPRVEPEIALRFAHDLEPGADRAAVLAAVESAHAALEIVDSVWSGYRFRIEDNTADGSSAAGVAFGPVVAVDRIADIEVRLRVGDEEVGRGRGSDASGHPADGVVWLVDQLADRGARVRAGDLVITGGLTAATPLLRGGVVSAGFDATTTVSVRDGRTILG